MKKYLLKVQAERSITDLEWGLSTGTDLGTQEASVIVWKHCVLSHLSWVLLTSGRDRPRATGKCSTMLQTAPQWSIIHFPTPTVWRAKVLSYSHQVVNKILKSMDFLYILKRTPNAWPTTLREKNTMNSELISVWQLSDLSNAGLPCYAMLKVVHNQENHIEKCYQNITEATHTTTFPNPPCPHIYTAYSIAWYT